MSTESYILRFTRLLAQVARNMSENVYLYGKVLAHVLLGGVLHLGVGLSLPLTALGIFTAYLITGGWRFARVVVLTVPRDIRGLHVLLRVRLGVRKHTKNNMTIPKLFDRTLKRYPNKAAMLMDDQKWTYTDVDQHSNAVANYFYEAGFRKGDVVSIFMESRPEFVCLWLGLAKIGVVSSLLNFNLRGDSLYHCISVSGAKAIIFGGELSQALKEIHGKFPNDTQFYCSGPMSSNDIRCQNLDALLEKCPTYKPPTVQQAFRDKLIYIYTSGTTGLPKAAVITHTRFYFMMLSLRVGYKITSKDVLYNSLPLYHSAGGILGVGNMLIGGTTLAIRKKFSASNFWDDCVKYRATVAQYIGEICRYLLAQPFRPAETKHKVHLMFGNGLRPQLWEEFQRRFNVGQMGEFYGATEGNASVMNMTNKVGSVGFTTRILPIAYPITLIRVDEATGEPLRDEHGLCIRAQPGESGELVGKIRQGDPLREFDGYVCKNATSKKTARDVFHKGDQAFLTGDVLEMDELGNLFFKDRTGDTFRWKGENVSTSEVEAVISNVLKLTDAVVYGVEVPGAEGKAGMVAISVEHGSVDLKSLGEDLNRALPAYARPLFVRLMKEVDKTGTFKLKKTELRKVAYSPSATKDQLFYMDSRTKQYQPITPQVFEDIFRGVIKL